MRRKASGSDGVRDMNDPQYKDPQYGADSGKVARTGNADNGLSSPSAGDMTGSAATPKPAAAQAKGAKKSTRGSKAKIDSVASSLKMVYQNAVDESVPDEMLDLLKQLG